jgi:hypothetical protein
VWFSAHDSGTVKVQRTIFVLSSGHGYAHASVTEHLNTEMTLCEQQMELRPRCNKMGKGGGEISLNTYFMWWKMYSSSSFYFLNKKV